ncbi:hypothetical protein, partial [Collinsella tanakaei]
AAVNAAVPVAASGEPRAAERAAAPASPEDRTAKMEAKLAAMDPEKAAKIRAALAAKGVKTAPADSSSKDNKKEGE